MTLLLHKTRAQARIEGLDLTIWDEDDYATVDETTVGRLYTQRIHGDMKWVWYLQTDPVSSPNTGIADTLDEAKAAFKKRYEEVKKGEVTGR
jgi:hypothetical protein